MVIMASSLAKSMLKWITSGCLCVHSKKGEIEVNLVYYSLIAIDVEIIAALIEGLKEAYIMLKILNMAPSN
jgi:hypothetical protein